MWRFPLATCAWKRRALTTTTGLAVRSLTVLGTRSGCSLPSLPRSILVTGSVELSLPSCSGAADAAVLDNLLLDVERERMSPLRR